MRSEERRGELEEMIYPNNFGIFIHHSVFMIIEYQVTLPKMPHVSSMKPNLPLATSILMQQLFQNKILHLSYQPTDFIVHQIR